MELDIGRFFCCQHRMNFAYVETSDNHIKYFYECDVCRTLKEKWCHPEPIIAPPLVPELIP